MHLGPEAHKMIGQGIAQEIVEDHGDSWFAHEKKPTNPPIRNDPPPRSRSHRRLETVGSKQNVIHDQI